METGDSERQLNVARPGMTSRRKVILSVQAVLALLVIVAIVRALVPGEGITLTESTTSSSLAPSVSSPNGANPGRRDNATRPAVAIPQKLGAATLVDSLTGREAIDDMSMLHGKGVGLTGGWVGHYQARGTAFVGEAEDEKSAAELLDTMVARIGAGNRVFTNLRRSQTDGQTLYFVTGQGQSHYFYQKGDKVIWLALPTNKPEDFLGDALRLIN